MSHYKSNLRDIEFNLFEVLGRDEVLGTGPFERDRRRDRPRDPRRGRPAVPRGPRRVVRGQRPQPAGLRPGDAHRAAAGVVQEELPRLDGRRVLAPQIKEELGGTPAPSSLNWAIGRDGARRQRARSGCTAAGPAFAGVIHRNGNERDKRIAQHIVDREWGTTMVLTEPDAGSDVGAGRTKATAERRRHLEHRGRQALHHLGERDMQREHHPPRAGPPGRRRGRRRPRHQGPVAVHRAEVPLRPGDRRADRRAQRRLRHQRRAQDGHQGLQHLRGDLRRDGHRRRRAGQRLAARRGAQRHRADVPGHRERPDDGRHQGHRDAVDRLPQRARLRQGPRPGRRPDPVRRQDRAARHDHPPPRRTPLADDAEVVRRGHARAGALHRVVAGPGPGRRARGQVEQRRGQAGRGGQRPAAADREGLRLGALVGAARHRVAADLRRLRLPAGVPASSSTSATPRSTPSTRAPRRSRARTSSSARSSRTRAPRSATWPARSRRSSTARPATAGSRSSASCSPPRSRTPTRSSAT